MSDPTTLTLLPTYKCTAACTECCFGCNPTINDRIPQERLLGYIRQAAEIESICSVVISGGEAFLLGDDLTQLIHECNRHSLATRIVTNGYWATSPEGARRRISPLVEAGLNEINFSTGDDHVAWVPLETVVQGMAASYEFGLTQALMIESRRKQGITVEDVLACSAKHPGLNNALKNDAIPVIESPWMKFSSCSGDDPTPTARTVNRANVHDREPCKSVYSTIVVPPNEQLGMCCGLPREEIPALSVGDLRKGTIGEYIDAARHDFLKIWIAVEGPEKILAWAAEKEERISWENRHAHNCDACRQVFSDPLVLSTIADHYAEKLDEVLFLHALRSASMTATSDA